MKTVLKKLLKAYCLVWSTPNGLSPDVFGTDGLSP